MSLLPLLARASRRAAILLLAATMLTVGLRGACTPSAADRCPCGTKAQRKRPLPPFVAGVTTKGGADFVPVPSASPPSTMTAHSGASSRSLSRLLSRSTASRRWLPSTRNGREGAVQGAFRRRHQGCAGVRREGASASRGSHPLRHDRPTSSTRSWRIGLPPRGTRDSTGPIPISSISRCWSCSPICARNDFKTFIVSGGGVEFMRPWTEQVYGIPPEQVVGSSGATKFELGGGSPVLMKCRRSSSSMMARASRSASTASSAGARFRLRQLRR